MTLDQSGTAIQNGQNINGFPRPRVQGAVSICRHNVKTLVAATRAGIVSCHACEPAASDRAPKGGVGRGGDGGNKLFAQTANDLRIVEEEPTVPITVCSCMAQGIAVHLINDHRLSGAKRLYSRLHDIEPPWDLQKGILFRGR